MLFRGASNAANIKHTVPCMNFPAGQESSDSEAVAAGVVVVLLVVIILPVGTVLIVVFLTRKRKRSTRKSRLWCQFRSWSDGPKVYTYCLFKLQAFIVIL